MASLRGYGLRGVRLGRMTLWLGRRIEGKEGGGGLDSGFWRKK
jgi:hypothetical protein